MLLLYNYKRAIGELYNIIIGIRYIIIYKSIHTFCIVIIMYHNYGKCYNIINLSSIHRKFCLTVALDYLKF